MLNQNPMSQMAMASKLSIPQLQQALRDGTVDPIIGQTILRQKIKQNEDAKNAMAAMQPAQPPVAQQNLAYGQGVSGLPTNMPTQGMADGGIIAFSGKDGSYVQDFNAPGMSEQDEAYARAMNEEWVTPMIGRAAQGAFPLTQVPGLVGKGIGALKDMTLVADPDHPGKTITRGELANRYPKAADDSFNEAMRQGRKTRTEYEAQQQKTAPSLGSVLSRQDQTAKYLAGEQMPSEAQLMAGANAAKLRNGDYESAPIAKDDSWGINTLSRGRGQGYSGMAPTAGYNTAKFDDSILRQMMAGENNPATGKPYTYEEISARNKERGITAGLDSEIYNQGLADLEAKKTKSASRSRMDEAMPWFAASRAFGEAKAGEGVGSTIGRALSGYGTAKGEILDKDEARDEAIRKEALQLHLAKNQFIQAQMAGDKTDMKSADDAIKSIQMSMHGLGVKSTEAQNEAAKTAAELENRRIIAQYETSHADARSARAENQIDQYARDYQEEQRQLGNKVSKTEARAYAIKMVNPQFAAIDQRDIASQRKIIGDNIKVIQSKYKLPGIPMSTEDTNRLNLLNAQLTALGDGAAVQPEVNPYNLKLGK